MDPRPTHRPVVFVDIDGTFLWEQEDDQTRIDRLERLQRHGPVVFVSSRTVPNMHRLLRRFGFRGDFIAENGALFVVRDGAIAALLGSSSRFGQESSPWYLQAVGRSTDELLKLVAGTVANPVDSTAEEIVGRGVLDAGRRGRWASIRIPALVGSTPQGRFAVAALRRAGLNVANGGRWITIWAGPDKGMAAARYLSALETASGRPSLMCAVGNAENDRPLLEAAAVKWAFPGLSGRHSKALVGIPGITLLPPVPSDGWAMIEQDLQHLGDPR